MDNRKQKENELQQRCDLKLLYGMALVDYTARNSIEFNTSLTTPSLAVAFVGLVTIWP